MRAAYAEADCVLEYGSGGSTMLALELGVRKLMSVESDPDWAAQMQANIAAQTTTTEAHLYHVDIGPTKAWGAPAHRGGWARYHTYPTSIWDADFFTQPDLVLIDGRFRPGCLLTVMTRTETPVTVIFDDYVGRPYYAKLLEPFIKPTKVVGRAAIFDVVPTALNPKDLSAFLKAFTCIR